MGKPNVTARLLKESGDIDVFVLSSEGHEGLNKPKPVTLSERVQEPIPLGPLGQAAAILVATWIMCAFLESFLGYRAVGLLFLLAVFAGSLLLNRSSILILAFAAGLIWDVFFHSTTVFSNHKRTRRSDDADHIFCGCISYG